jgi:Ca-activated chloride channel family protein
MTFAALTLSLWDLELRLAHPERWPWLALALLAAALVAWETGMRRRALRRLTRSEELRRLAVPHLAPGLGIVRASLVVLGVALLGLALLRPQLGQREVAVKRRGIDLVVAVDASHSMQARDVLPSRLARAKLELSSLIDRLTGDRVGLVAFAGEAFVQCPLTHDYAAAKLFLRAIDPEAMPSQGTAIGRALETAAAMFEAAEDGARSRVVLLLTDGEDHSGRLDAAVRSLAEKGIRVYALGVGTGAGSPIPILDAEGNVVSYRKDRAGRTVVSRLEEDQLRRIAEATGGRYVAASGSDLGMAAIADELDRLEKTEREGHLALRWDEVYHYVLAPALALLFLAALLSERRAG